MKKKILFFGWEYHQQENIQNEVQKLLGNGFELIFATHDRNALDEIAKAKLLQNNPFCAVIFNRNALVENTCVCRMIAKFAEHYQDTKYLVSINLIYNDQDVEARDCAVSAHFAKQGSLKHIATIIKNNV